MSWNEAAHAVFLPRNGNLPAGCPVEVERLRLDPERKMRMAMNWKATVFSAAAVIMLAAGPAWAGCSASDKIDNTTADQTKHKILAAGYTNVADLKKGCD